MSSGVGAGKDVYNMYEYACHQIVPHFHYGFFHLLLCFKIFDRFETVTISQYSLLTVMVSCTSRPINEFELVSCYFFSPTLPPPKGTKLQSQN